MIPDAQNAIVSGAIFIPAVPVVPDTPLSLYKKYSTYSSTTARLFKDDGLGTSGLFFLTSLIFLILRGSIYLSSTIPLLGLSLSIIFC